jgi:AraC family transcriptional regulator, transcriptional activator of pobA
MGIKTEHIPVYPVSVFNTDCPSFWIGSLEQIADAYPFLQKPHRQEFYMMLYMQQAKGVLVIDNREIFLDQCRMICIKPNSVFSVELNGHASGYMVCFTESFFSLRYNNNVLHRFSFLKENAGHCQYFTEQQNHKWSNICALMVEEFNGNQEDTENVLRSYLNILLHDLKRQPGHYAHSKRIGVKEEKLIQFEQLVEENYLKHKTPSFYAEQLHITTNYLNKLCQAGMGKTGGEIIRNRTVIEAQRLLRFTSLTVAEIGYEIGFESPSYFITFFKKSMGVTPEYFRKNNN